VRIFANVHPPTLQTRHKISEVNGPRLQNCLHDVEEQA